ncbi:unnamed protein product [Boreogadus saida]
MLALAMLYECSGAQWRTGEDAQHANMAAVCGYPNLPSANSSLGKATPLPATTPAQGPRLHEGGAEMP